AIDRRDEELPGAKLDDPLGPHNRVPPGRFPAALDDDLPAAIGWAAPRVDRDDNSLTAKSRGTRGDQRRIGDGSRVERHLVGPRPEHVAHVVDAPDAATDRQRDERPPGRLFDDVEERAAALGCGRDVEEYELIRALRGVALRELGRISPVDEVDEPGALHDASVGNG